MSRTTQIRTAEVMRDSKTKSQALWKGSGKPNY